MYRIKFLDGEERYYIDGEQVREKDFFETLERVLYQELKQLDRKYNENRADRILEEAYKDALEELKEYGEVIILNTLFERCKITFKDNQENYIYLFPDDLSTYDLSFLKKFNLKLLGHNFEGFVVKGTKENLEEYAEELGYVLHPDYLYKEKDFAGDIKQKK